MNINQTSQKSEIGRRMSDVRGRKIPNILLILFCLACVTIGHTSIAQNVLVAKAVPGALHEANSQVATSGTAGTLVIARPTRTSCLVKNLDATITVYIGAATVTSGNGMPLKAGESVVITAGTLWQVIAASGTPTVAVIDEYN